MPDYRDLTCPVCGRPFTERDDLVVCPACGAPHHRACWKKTGHCRYSKQHGTPEQWKRPPRRDDEDARNCGNCGCANEPEAAVCRKCGKSLLTEDEPDNSFQGKDRLLPPLTLPFSTPPPRKEPAFNGQPTEDITTFIGRRSDHYLSRFQMMRAQRGRISWNWAAFLFPVPWLAYRKMKRPFLVFFLLTLLFCAPIGAVMLLNYRELTANPEAMQAFLALGDLPELVLPGWLNVLYGFSVPLLFLLRMILGCIGNSLYQRHVLRQVSRIRGCHHEPLHCRYELSRRGGTSLLAVAALMVLSLLLLIAFCLMLAYFATPIL